MSGHDFQSFREMPGIFSHFAYCLVVTGTLRSDWFLLGITRNDWFHRLTVTYTTHPTFLLSFTCIWHMVMKQIPHRMVTRDWSQTNHTSLRHLHLLTMLQYCFKEYVIATPIIADTVSQWWTREGLPFRGDLLGTLSFEYSITQSSGMPIWFSAISFIMGNSTTLSFLKHAMKIGNFLRAILAPYPGICENNKMLVF